MREREGERERDGERRSEEDQRKIKESEYKDIIRIYLMDHCRCLAPRSLDQRISVMTYLSGECVCVGSILLTW